MKFVEQNVRGEKKLLAMTPLRKMKKPEISATITKEQFLKQNAVNESGEYSFVHM